MSLPFPIIFQNNHYIIINKPAGMPVYSTRHHPGLLSVEHYFSLLSKRKEGPWLVHRLDQDTAGCLMIALRKQALIRAQTWFNQKQVTKLYWAIVEGVPQQKEGTINMPLLKETKNKQWKMIPDHDGQIATTQWKVLGNNQDYSCIELQLITGRTHQARAHCAFLGHPILGDTRYGSSVTQTPLQLLSRTICINSEPSISATAFPPDHMINLLKNLSIPDFRL